MKGQSSCKHCLKQLHRCCSYRRMCMTPRDSHQRLEFTHSTSLTQVQAAGRSYVLDFTSRPSVTSDLVHHKGLHLIITSIWIRSWRIHTYRILEQFKKHTTNLGDPNGSPRLSSVLQALIDYPITGHVYVKFSVPPPSWPWHRRPKIWLAVATVSCLFTDIVQATSKAQGRFYLTWQHKAAEI